MNAQKVVLIKRLLLAPLSLFFLSLIYPFSTSLFVYYDIGESSSLDNCAAFPVYSITKIISLILLVHFLLIIPIIFGWVKSALYLILCTVLLLVFGSGGWMLMMAFVYLLCESFKYSNEIIIPSVVTFSLLTVLGFVFYWKPRLIKVIKLNKRIYDFESNLYYFVRPHIRLDGIKHTNISSYVVGVAVLSSLLVSKFDFAVVLHNPTPLTGTLFYLFIFSIAYVILGVICLNQLYVAWCIYRHNAKHGSKMLVAELVDVNVKKN